MSEPSESTLPAPNLSHFALFRFRHDYLVLSSQGRSSFQEQWLGDLRRAAGRVEIYQVFGLRPGADFLVWSAIEATAPNAPAAFFEAFGRATGPHGLLVELVDSLWGLTRPSPYLKGRPARGIDPLGGERKPYLTVYPFVKSADWYLLNQESRQGMMNQHIRIGRTYPEVDQLLLYSFGLQDQEFVVVYEMDDLTRYSQLVQELRQAEGRAYTTRDTPIYTALHRPLDQAFALWG